jgi:hypothetical protein
VAVCRAAELADISIQSDMQQTVCCCFMSLQRTCRIIETVCSMGGRMW